MKKAYILCSGLGQKMWPYSDKWQKSCLPIGNIPNILRLIKNIKAAGIEQIVVVAGYKAQQIRYCLRNEEGIIIIEENNSTGTAKSLLRALEQEMCDDILVAYGDTFVDACSIKDVISSYDKYGPSILEQEIHGDIRSIDWICTDVNNGEVKAIFGHPRSHYVNSRIAGVFMLNKEIVPYLKTNPGRILNVPVGGMPPEENMLEQSLQMMLEDGINIKAIPVNRYYIDLDKPWNILEANEMIIKETFENLNDNDIAENSYIDESAVVMGKIRIGKGSKIGKNVIIKGDVWIGDNTVIDYGAILEGDTIIGNNCIIADNCKISPYSTIGNNNRIGFSAEIQGITFDKVSIVHTSEVYGIVGSNTDIAAGCMMGILRFDDSACKQKIGGKVEAGSKYSNAIYLGDYSRTGISNIFYPSVKVGSNCALGPGAIIDKDVPSNTLVIVEQNKVYKEWGTSKYGW